MIRVVCWQLAPRVGEFDTNAAASVEAIRRAAEAGADVIVLPELVTSGYVFESAAEVESVAITPDHVLFGEWAEAAGSAVVVGGFAESAPDGRLYNSAALISGGRVRAVYRKTHLWDREKLFFTPGPETPKVVETVVGRLAVLICYDLEFPELTRTVALAGAELIVAPTNWPLMPRPPHERPAEVTNVMATARINHVAIACCDRAGIERGQAWTEGTAIVDENGWVLATAGEGVGSAAAELDLTRSRDKTLSPFGDSFGDRRPELYGAVTAPAPRTVT